MIIIKPNAEIISPNITSPAVVINMYKQIETAGRTCYKSKNKKVAELETRISELKEIKEPTVEQMSEMVELLTKLEEAKIESAKAFVRGLVKSGHEAMIEHVSMTVRFTVDRGISHELVRHRLASWAQESSRYCNYGNEKFGNEIKFIEPVFYESIPKARREMIQNAVENNFKNTPSSFERMSNLEKRYVDWCYACYISEQSYLEMIKLDATPEEARDVLTTSVKTEVIMTMNMRELRHFLKLRAVGTTGKPHPQMVEVAMPLLKQCREKMPELFDDII